MNIGGKPYSLDIDTGSNLTWLECKHPDYHCKTCKVTTVCHGITDLMSYTFIS